MEIKIQHLKSTKEYKEELEEIYEELGHSIETDTLIESDLKLLTRIDEILVILSFIQIQKAKKKKTIRSKGGDNANTSKKP